jgi:hypothetical protein
MIRAAQLNLDKLTSEAFLVSTANAAVSAGLCSRPLVKIQASDLRRRQMMVLGGLVEDPMRVVIIPDRSLQDCHSLLRILEKEYKGNAGAKNARLYYDAFRISIIHGDQARASAFAKMSFSARVLCEGEDSPEAKKMKPLVENPDPRRVRHPKI